MVWFIPGRELAYQPFVIPSREAARNRLFSFHLQVVDDEVDDREGHDFSRAVRLPKICGFSR